MRPRTFMAINAVVFGVLALMGHDLFGWAGVVPPVVAYGVLCLVGAVVE